MAAQSLSMSGMQLLPTTVEINYVVGRVVGSVVGKVGCGCACVVQDDCAFDLEREDGHAQEA